MHDSHESRDRHSVSPTRRSATVSRSTLNGRPRVGRRGAPHGTVTVVAALLVAFPSGSMARTT
jgi:hypothetical protein